MKDKHTKKEYERLIHDDTFSDVNLRSKPKDEAELEFERLANEDAKKQRRKRNISKQGGSLNLCGINYHYFCITNSFTIPIFNNTIVCC